MTEYTIFGEQIAIPEHYSAQKIDDFIGAAAAATTKKDFKKLISAENEETLNLLIMLYVVFANPLASQKEVTGTLKERYDALVNEWVSDCCYEICENLQNAYSADWQTSRAHRKRNNVEKLHTFIAYIFKKTRSTKRDAGRHALYENIKKQVIRALHDDFLSFAYDSIYDRFTRGTEWDVLTGICAVRLIERLQVKVAGKYYKRKLAQKQIAVLILESCRSISYTAMRCALYAAGIPNNLSFITVSFGEIGIDFRSVHSYHIYLLHRLLDLANSLYQIGKDLSPLAEKPVGVPDEVRYKNIWLSSDEQLLSTRGLILSVAALEHIVSEREASGEMLEDENRSINEVVELVTTYAVTGGYTLEIEKIEETTKQMLGAMMFE